MVRGARDSVAAVEERVKPRTKLGSWTLLTGNSCDVYLAGDGDLRQITCKWDRFPLSPEETVFYVLEILPALTRHAMEYLEKPCRRAMVVLL
jgi:hypothetical protein